MTIRRLLVWGFVLSILTAVAVYTIDGVVAASLQSSVATNRSFVTPVVTALEYLFAFPLSKFATGLIIVVVAVVLFAMPKWRGTARLLLFVGLTHLTARLVAGVLKNVFLRTRPLDALVTGSWRDQFFVEGGSSFPSGHAAHFWALFFAFVVAFPRLRVPALVLSLFVSAARVAVNDHYVSDVVASAAISAFAACLCALLVLPKHARADAQVTVTSAHTAAGSAS